MQSATHNIGHYVVVFDNKDRWENPLMGWCSSGDPLSNLELQFSTKHEAISYCDRHGWDWLVMRSNIRKKMKIRSYSQNFDDKRYRLTTK